MTEVFQAMYFKASFPCGKACKMGGKSRLCID